MTYPELTPSAEAFESSQYLQSIPVLPELKFPRYAPGGLILPNAESVIYETESEDREHRIKIGSQTLTLPPSAEVDVQVSKDGSGVVTVVIPADSVRVIPAGKRVVKSRKRDRDAQEQASEAAKSDAD